MDFQPKWGQALYQTLLNNEQLSLKQAIKDPACHLNNDGFKVWRQLTADLEPTSRSLSLAMAQALLGFPPMSNGANLTD